MTSNEDCASVLEGFIHDVANLPLEINHMMEEIQAKDKDMQKYQSIIATKDNSLQKHVKANGSMTPHPKEAEYSQTILQNLDLCEALQDQKISLSEKACVLLDRQIKRLDVKIKELQKEGLLSNDPPIPSLFHRKHQHPDSGRNFFANLVPTDNTALQLTSGNAIHPTQRMMQQQIAQPRVSQISSNGRNSAPSTPASAAQHIQSRRESSAGANDVKRRRLNATISNLPAQSSNLRQSSLGPGTPKAGTPTGGAGRAGSAGPRSIAGSTKKGQAATKNIKAPHQQISKLKGQPTKRIHTSGTHGGGVLKKRSGGSTSRNSPSVRLSGGGNATGDDDDSILSSADVSDADSHNTTRSHRRTKHESATAGSDGANDLKGSSSASDHPGKHADSNSTAGGGTSGIKKNPRSNASDEEMEDADVDSADDEEEEEEQEDTREYCFCHRVSFGDMVGCENKDCPYEWFHLDCVGLKKAPGEKDTWYCSECEAKGFKSVLHGK